MEMRAKVRDEKKKRTDEVIDIVEEDQHPPDRERAEEEGDELLSLDDDALLESQDVSDLIEHEEEKKLPALRSTLPVKHSKEDKDSSHQLDLLQKYFREIRKYPLLTKEEEYDLAMRFAQTEDPKLAFRLTTANLRLVVKIAMEYQSAVANLLDLIQEGNIGLMQAVKKFDPFKGIRLSSYAQWWIRAYILKYLVNNARMVKVGTTQAQRKLFFNLRKEKDKLEALGFKPEPALLAARLDVRVEEVREMEQRLSRADVSLDAPLGDDQKNKVSDLMATDEMSVDEQVISRELHEHIRGYMNEFAKGLKDREKVIWIKRLTADEPLTLQEIGDLFGVTRERARQIEKELTRRFREFLQKHIPDLDAADLLPS
jgi:RNA polymerase sigma-32 factor